MDRDYQNEHTVMYSKMTSTRFRTEKDSLYSNGNVQKSPGFRDKYLIRNLRPFNEDKFALLLLYFSIALVISKIIFAYSDVFLILYSFTISVFSFDKDAFVKIQTGFISLWSVVAPFNWITVPILVGLAVFLITWRVEGYLILNKQPESTFLHQLNLEPTKWYRRRCKLPACCGIITLLIAFFSWRLLLG